MLNNVMAILFANSETKSNELTIPRTAASLPYGSRYRLIDFSLSSLVNANITRIGIITSSNYNSLLDHIRMSRDWDLNRKNTGITVFPPCSVVTSKEVYKGKIDALNSIANYIEHAKEEYVVLADAHMVANFDYEQIVNNHIASKKPITMVYCNKARNSARRTVINVNKQNIVDDMFISEVVCDETASLGLNVYVVNKDFLLSQVSYENARSNVDFEKDLLSKFIKSKSINAYLFKGYNSLIDDVYSYYTSSMMLLDKQVRTDLFGSHNKIYTKVKDSVPTVYGMYGKAQNSLIADGCIINGKVTNSILFRNVVVEHGAVIKDSIIMEGSVISANSKVSYTITDKRVTISPNMEISGFSTYPLVIVKGKTI